MNRPALALWHSVALALIVASLYQYFASSTHLQSAYPAKPVKVIIPYDPGGATDTFARIIQKGVTDNNLMPQPLVIVNKPGGGTTIGSGYVVDARNDGYTMLCLHEAIITAYVTGQSPHGPAAFEPVAATGEIVMVILVPENSPYERFEDLIADAKAKPDTIKLGVTLSMPTHFTGLMIEEAAPGVRFRFVSSGGGAARLASLIGGHVDASFFSVSEYIRFKENGLRPLATFSDERHPGVPEVPTARELGIDVSNTNLQYWWFPKGTSPEIISYFTDILNQAMQTDYVRERLDELSILPQVITGDNLRKRIDSRMKAFSEMTIIDRVALPNVVGWTLGAILVFGLGLVRKLLGEKNQSPHEDSGLSLRFDLVWIVLAAVAVYVLVMAMGWISFVWATLLFVLFCCASLGCLNRRSWLFACELSVLVSFGVHVVFTQIFLITLP